MSPAAKLVIGLAALGVVLGLVGVPFWGILLVVLGIPIGGYLMLDPSQRKRLRAQGRKQIGS